MPDETIGTAKFHDEFVKANANVDFIADRFSDVLRNLIRAFAAQDPTAAIYRAAEEMDFVAELLSKTEENFGFRTLFARTLEAMDAESEISEAEGAIVDAAKSGVKFLVERSCADNAARGRASRRQNEFMDDIRRIEETRKARRKSTGQ